MGTGSRHPLIALLVGLVIPMAPLACGGQTPVPPRSLSSPAGMATARSCVATLDGVDVRTDPARCGEGGDLTGGVQTLAVLANRERRSLMLLAMDQNIPALVDTERAVPGVTGVPVCDGPGRVGVTPDGNFAVVSCDVAQQVSIVAIPLEREVLRINRSTPELDMSAAPDQPLFAFVRPETATLRVERLDYTCEGAVDAFPRDCDPSVDLQPVAEIALPGRPAAVVAGKEGRFYVSYQDRGYVSRFELGAQAGTCIDGAAAGPCETLRVGLAAECRDGLDNDGDGLVDQADPQCFDPNGVESADSPRGHLTACTDGLDNDGDGLVDHDDPDCLSALDDDERGGVRRTACDDGVDNDGDGLTDLDDPDCPDPLWDDESRAPACANGIDDDQDGQTDGDDPDCVVPLWDDESRAPACANGLDDDNDGLIDFPADPDCLAPAMDTEATLPACDNGFDDDGDGFVDRADPGCDDPSDTSEEAAAPVCADGADNDGDGLTDLADPDCYGAAGRSERGPDPLGFGPLGLDDAEKFLLVSDSLSHQLLVVDLEAGKLLDAGVDDPLHGRAGVPITTGGVVGRSLAYTVESTDDTTFPGQTDTVSDTIAVAPASDGFAIVVDLAHQISVTVGSDTQETSTLRLRPRDGDTGSAQVSGIGCTIPDDYRELVRAARGGQAALRVACTDPEVPQLAALDDAATTVKLRSVTRSTAVEGGLQSEDVPDDWRLRAEDWTLDWEGVLPGSERDDGLIDATHDGLLLSAGVDFCGLGVQAGDRVLIDEPTPALDASADACAAFQNGSLEYRVAYVRADALYLAATGEEGLVQDLPTRDCFAAGFKYRVRAAGAWLVTGSTSGLVQDQVSLSEQCVPGTGDPRRTGRARDDADFTNSFFSLRVQPGSVPPTRDTQLTFSVDNRFAITALQTGPDPVDINLSTTAAGRRVSISDGGVNTLFIFDAATLLALTQIF